MSEAFDRQVLPDGSVRMTSGTTEFLFARPKANVLVVTMVGYDKGQFGTAPLDEIGSVLRVAAPVHVFVDARKGVGATARVSEDWTRFLTRHAADIAQVHVLVGSKMLELTIAIARHLSRIERLMRIYSDPALFETQLEAACKRHAR